MQTNDDAHKRAMSQLLLHKIAQVEKLSATEEEVEVELIRLLATVQDADEERAKAYLYQALTNDKVLTFLEKAATVVSLTSSVPSVVPFALVIDCRWKLFQVMLLDVFDTEPVPEFGVTR